MQSMNVDMNAKEAELTAIRRKRMRPTPKTAMHAWTRPCVLVLLFVASLTYIGFGDNYDELSPFEPETSIAALALRPQDSGNSRRDENALSIVSLPAEKLLLPSDPVSLR